MDTATITSHLLTLPRELRHRILLYTLWQSGPIELQQPMWASKAHYAQPVFQVSRLLRREAAQAFYETNCFLWILDLFAAVERRSDPSGYVSMTISDDDEETTKQDHPSPSSPPSPNSSIPSRISVLPWEYPSLRTHLRHLHVNIYLPPRNPSDDFRAPSSQAWQTSMPNQLQRMVSVLDRGRRLQELTVLVTANAKGFNPRLALESEQVAALEVLGGMEIRGTVTIRTRFDFRAARVSVEALELEKKMKARQV
ncbi:hypothetical protein NU219Hw_g5443t1 [Hortaea werneckii]